MIDDYYNILLMNLWMYIPKNIICENSNIYY